MEGKPVGDTWYESRRTVHQVPGHPWSSRLGFDMLVAVGMRGGRPVVDNVTWNRIGLSPR